MDTDLAPDAVLDLVTGLTDAQLGRVVLHLGLRDYIASDQAPLASRQTELAP